MKKMMLVCLLTLCTGVAPAAIIFSIEEVGNDVVVTASGSIDVSELSGPGYGGGGNGMRSGDATLLIGGDINGA